MCLRKQALQSFWQRIQDLRLLGQNGTLTPSKKWKAKSNSEEILLGKIFEIPTPNKPTYNFVPKNAMKLHFDKSFCPVFSKTGGVLGQSPKVLRFLPSVFVFSRLGFYFDAVLFYGVSESPQLFAQTEVSSVAVADRV